MTYVPRTSCYGVPTSWADGAHRPLNANHAQVGYNEAFATLECYDAINAAWRIIGAIKNNGVPTDGVSGTGAGYIAKGTLCIDTVHGLLYQNEGSASSPTWVTVGTESY